MNWRKEFNNKALDLALCSIFQNSHLISALKLVEFYKQLHIVESHLFKNYLFL